MFFKDDYKWLSGWIHDYYCDEVPPLFLMQIIIIILSVLFVIINIEIVREKELGLLNIDIKYLIH